MNGRILEFNIQKSSGKISGDDGQRYAFSAADWKSDVSPRAGITVDFVTAEDGSAREIYASPDDTADIRNMSGSMKKSIIAIVCAVLAFFIPVVGIVLSIVGLVLGRQARIASKADGDENAALIALIAIIVAAISLIFAAIALLSLLFIGTGLAILGSGGML